MYPTEAPGMPPCSAAYPNGRLTPRQELRREMFAQLISNSHVRSIDAFDMKTMVVKAVEMADIMLDTEPAQAAKKEG